jgi:adenosylmethionine-8-amino-7-oxononanoate aminotransferase
MASDDWVKSGLTHLWRPYCQMKTADLPLPVVATEGSQIHLADGRILIDGIASWWTACHGYNQPHMRKSVAKQLKRMPHVMFGGLMHEQAATLASRLCALTPGGFERVFFSDSGSVAVEVALKMAAQFWLNQGIRTKRKFLAFKGAYHGDTFATMTICDPDDGMHSLFSGLLQENIIADLPRDTATREAFDALVAQHADEIAGIIVEPLVQGAGGMIFHEADVLRHIRATADKRDLLLIFDEIFTGFGRTGTMFASESAGVAPDILCLGKALTGGTMTLAATLATPKIFNAFWSDDATHALMHGPTFMANALACTAANASLDLFETEPRLTQVKAIEGTLAEGLSPCRNLDHVKNMRVKGAIGVIEMKQRFDVEAAKRRFVELGVFIRPFGRIVYVTPAFTISPEELRRLTDAIVTITRELKSN